MPLEDGMRDPRVGGEELATRRQEAIRDVLKLMGCNHRRGDNCDHIDAVRVLGEAMTDTAVVIVMAAIRLLPRPLQMRAIEEVGAAVRTVVLLPVEKPEERRKL